jgi:predicted nucleic acid-binding protein
MSESPTKQTVYIETTVISYLTARRSRDLIRAAQQETTREWWETRSRFDIYASELVIAEASAGDPTAAAERLAVLAAIPLLRVNEEADQLAKKLVIALAIPRSELRDALHVAIAAVNGVDFLLTWNCRHLANLHQRGRIEQVCRDFGYQPPLIGTPGELGQDSP